MGTYIRWNAINRAIQRHKRRRQEMKTEMNIWKQIESAIYPNEKYQLGFANMEGLLPVEFCKFRFAISIVRNLESQIIDKTCTGPTKEYFNQYQEVNRELRENIQNISAILTVAEIPNLPISPTVHDSELPKDYYDRMRLPISHKMIATRAGLGWIGKTDLLITLRYGPRVRLSSVLLDKELIECGKPIVKSQCGECNKCVESCPAHAATGKEWNYTIDRDEFYDPLKCRVMCRKLSKEAINEEISLCGICVSVCPKGRRKSGG